MPTFRDVLGHIKRFFIGGTTFCCCLPVRFGVISMSLITILIAGSLSIILWYEYGVVESLTATEMRNLFVVAMLETLLMLASIFGFIGSVVRKQLFVNIYSYFLYVHFTINFSVATYFLVMIGKATDTAVIKACQDTIDDPDASAQCSGILDIIERTITGIIVIVLLVEFYNALVVTRYVRLLRGQKRTAREAREARRESRIKMLRESSHTTSHHSVHSDDFDPYQDTLDTKPLRSHGSEEGGYGGGSWTHERIASDLKERELEDGGYDGLPKIKSSYAPVQRAASTSAPPRYDDL